MQLDFIRWIQSFHTPTLDQIMVWISELGGEDFYLLFGPIFFWCAGLGLGLRLLIPLLGSFYLNHVLKDGFGTTRPMLAHPDAVRLPEGAAATAQDDDGGWQAAFPSGHAQHAAVFWMFIGLWARRPAVWAATALMIFLISLSRIYLGVHWPIDILGGWALGAAVVGGMIVLPPLIERLPQRRREQLLLGAAAGGLLLFAIDSAVFRAKILGFWSASLSALVVQQRYFRFKVDVSPVRQLAKIALGLIVVFALRAGLKAVLPEDAWGSWLRYAIIGVWVALGAPILFRLLFGAPASESQGDPGARADAERQRAA